MDKREAIIHGAIDTFKEKGIDKATVSDIVKKAGIAQGTFYLYFPSKLSVMPAIAAVMVEKMMDVIHHTVGLEEPFHRKLSQLVDAIFSVTETYQEVIALIYSGLAATDHIKQWEAVYEPVYSWLSKILHDAKQSGIIRETAHVDRTSKLIIGLIESAAEQIHLYDSNQEEDVINQKKEVLDFLTHALDIKE